MVRVQLWALHSTLRFGFWRSQRWETPHSRVEICGAKVAHITETDIQMDKNSCVVWNRTENCNQNDFDDWSYETTRCCGWFLTRAGQIPMSSRSTSGITKEGRVKRVTSCLPFSFLSLKAPSLRAQRLSAPIWRPLDKFALRSFDVLRASKNESAVVWPIGLRTVALDFLGSYGFLRFLVSQPHMRGWCKVDQGRVTMNQGCVYHLRASPGRFHHRSRGLNHQATGVTSPCRVG